MSEPEKYTTWDSWKSRCQEIGLEGPYQISGTLTQWQFVRKEGGTGALWNASHNLGYVFADCVPQRSPESDT